MLLQEFVTVLVRDPRTQKEDSWHSYIDYEIFIHVSMKASAQIPWALVRVSLQAMACFALLIELLYPASGRLEDIILLRTEWRWNR